MNTDESRRRFLGYFGGAGMSAALFPGILWSKLQEGGGQRVTREMIADAARLAGLELTDEERAEMVEGINENLETIEEIRELDIDNAVPPPMYFDPRVPATGGHPAPASPDPIPGQDRPGRPRAARAHASSAPADLRRPDDLEDVAFWPVTHLARLIETGQVSALELTEMYLDRLERHDGVLNCVVTLTAERALEHAALMDAETAAGHSRGPLHGIPFGVKDIIAARGYPTTWGAAPFRDRELAVDATVVERLEAAGGVLVAKLTTGELAFGDRWFGGRTNNPWNPEQGSSGSSAGSGAATAAGLVGFSIGTDTGGSILSPSMRCGVVGLRPTFGRVSRYGVMAAGFSLDKVGPMCRTAECCGVVLEAIAGPDDRDLAVPFEATFEWGGGVEPAGLRVGYFEAAFDEEAGREDADDEEVAHHRAALEAIRAMGFDLRSVELPRNRLIYFIEYMERAAGFDRFFRDGRVAELNSASRYMYNARLVPAVDYLQANRARFLYMQEVAAEIEGLDVVLAPYRGINPLTSMTGHPVAAVPTGFRADGTPTGIAFMGNLFEEAELLTLARAYQEATGFHLRHPEL